MDTLFIVKTNKLIQIGGAQGCCNSAVGARTILEDDRVLESIEASFRQFHGFLDLLKGSR